MFRLAALPVALAAACALTACGGSADAHGTAVGATPDPAGLVEPLDADLSAAPAMAALGEVVEVRPGVFATATARTQVVAEQGTGARISEEPQTRVLTVTVSYENRTDRPLAPMGTVDGVGNIATLDGRGFTLSFSGESTAMGAVFPGRTGQVVVTVQADAGAPAYDGQDVSLSVPRPALLGEPAASLFTAAAYYTGTPVSR